MFIGADTFPIVTQMPRFWIWGLTLTLTVSGQAAYYSSFPFFALVLASGAHRQGEELLASHEFLVKIV